MTDIDRLEQRLAAVERVVVDGDFQLEELSELATVVDAVDTLETRVEEHERRLADLEAAVQSVEGYVGSLESINDDVERQAASAIATVDRLERRVDKLEVCLDDLQGGLLEEPEPTEIDEPEEAKPVGSGTRGGDVESEDAGSGELNLDHESIAFEFDSEVVPERSAEGLLEGEGVVDDGVDRPASSANQAAVDSAVGDGHADEADEASGLFGALRARLS